MVFRRERNAGERLRLELNYEPCVPSRLMRLSCGLARLFDRVSGNFVHHRPPAVRDFAVKANRRSAGKSARPHMDQV